MFRFFPVEFRNQTGYGVIGITQCFFPVKLFIGYTGDFEIEIDNHHIIKNLTPKIDWVIGITQQVFRSYHSSTGKR